MRFLDIIESLFKDKWSIAYSIRKLSSMIPKKIGFISPSSIIGKFVMGVQAVWFLIKIMFFALIISWFLPQYKEAGAKAALLLIVCGIFFCFWWMVLSDSEKQNT